MIQIQPRRIEIGLRLGHMGRGDIAIDGGFQRPNPRSAAMIQQILFPLRRITGRAKLRAGLGQGGLGPPHIDFQPTRIQLGQNLPDLDHLAAREVHLAHHPVQIGGDHHPLPGFDHAGEDELLGPRRSGKDPGENRRQDRSAPGGSPRPHQSRIAICSGRASSRVGSGPRIWLWQPCKLA